MYQRVIQLFYCRVKVTQEKEEKDRKSASPREKYEAFEY